MALPAIMAGLQAAYGLYRGFKAKSALDELSGQRRPEFMDAANPLMQNKALQEQQYRQGLTPATRALYQNQQASTLASQQRAASEMSGGQMSNALSRMSGLNVNSGALQLAAQNEAAQRQGMQGMIGTNRELSGLQQRDIGQKLDYRNQMERGYGQAQQQAFQDVLGAGVGYAQMQMAQSEADKNREFYRNLYGIKEPTDTPSVTPETEAINPSAANSMMQGNINVPKIGGSYTYNLPLSMGGGQKLAFNKANLNNLPPYMGGTNTPNMGGTELSPFNEGYPNYFPRYMREANTDNYDQTSPNLGNLPPSMGGYNLGYGNNPYGIRSFTKPR